MHSRIMSLFSYLGVLVFVPLVSNRSDEYVNFHARQGLVIWIIGIVAIFMLYIPGLGKLAFGFLALMVMIYSLMGIVSVMLFRAWRLPIVYRLSTML
ncbi:hypothetical protein D5085_13180 [Ectothiorhodospiraceae bacterium BW-2]|nr:hypothetical protein D5085_13180 [Ectothiorhodospiraceae bacterium BW-2]